jgi:hypothetical protein
MLQLHTVKMGEEVQRTGSGPIYPMHVLPDVETIPLILNMFDQCFLLLQGVSGEVSPFFFLVQCKMCSIKPYKIFDNDAYLSYQTVLEYFSKASHVRLTPALRLMGLHGPLFCRTVGTLL